MAEVANTKPPGELRKPPGYKDPNAPLIPKPRTPRRKLPPVYHQKRKRTSCCRWCCCFCFVLILFLIIITAAAGGVFYLWYKPKLPSFHLQSIENPRFKVAVRSDGTFLDARTVVRVQARNPNEKIRFTYGQTKVRITVGDDDVDFGSASLAGFEQGKKNTTVVKASAEVKNEQIDDDVGTKLQAQYRSKQLAFKVEVRTSFGVRLGNWKTRTVGIKALCGDVSMKKINGDSSTKCKINVLKWINIS